MDYEFRVFNITYNGITSSRVCKDYKTFYKLLGEYNYWFCPHIPNFVDGATVDARAFDTKTELIEHIKNVFDKFNDDNNETLCMDKDGHIVEVRNDGDYWWVIGYTNLKPWTFPNWEEFAKSKRQNHVAQEYHANVGDIITVNPGDVDNLAGNGIKIKSVYDVVLHDPKTFQIVGVIDGVTDMTII